MASRVAELTDQGVKALRPREARYAEPDPEMAAHYIRVQPTGAKSFVVVTRDPYGKQVWTTIGSTDHLKIEQAREQARAVIARVKAGKPATEPPAPAPDSFAAVAAELDQAPRRRKEPADAGRDRAVPEPLRPARTGATARSPRSSAAMWRICSTTSRITAARGRPTRC